MPWWDDRYNSLSGNKDKDDEEKEQATKWWEDREKEVLEIAKRDKKSGDRCYGIDRNIIAIEDVRRAVFSKIGNNDCRDAKNQHKTRDSRNGLLGKHLIFNCDKTKRH